MSKRTTITNSIRWVRFIFGFLCLSFLTYVFNGGEHWQYNVLWFQISLILTWGFYKMRRVRFDDESIFRIYGKKEKIVPFTSIVSIKRSSIKLNNQRMWKVTYLDKDELEHKFLFLEGTFRHGSTKEFIKLATLIKPSIVVWEHPFFDHPEEEEKKD